MRRVLHTMRQSEWQWHCEFYDEAHNSDSADPYDEGPRMPGIDDVYYAEDWPEGAWTLHVDEFQGYAGNLWHFTCPGPHRNLWIGAVQ